MCCVSQFFVKRRMAQSSTQRARCSYSSAICSIASLVFESFISFARMRASSARVRQCSGSQMKAFLRSSRVCWSSVMLRLSASLRVPHFERGATKTFGIDGQHTGTAPPFPLWRLRSSPYWPSIDPIIREWFPQARIAGHLTLHPLIWFRSECGFLLILPNTVAHLLHTAR
jgi:hypothetical protein